MLSEGDGSAERARVALVKGPEGALSIELMHIREGVTRGFLKYSPRGLRLSEENSRSLGRTLAELSGGRLLVADTRKRLLSRSLEPHGWTMRRAVVPRIDHTCSMCTTYDIPLEESLMDDRGEKPDITNTSQMVGVSMDIGDRCAFGFYTDDGDTARVISEGPRKLGMLVAQSPEDMAEAADCLIRFLAAARKKWAVFSLDMGRFVRRHDPMVMWRMVLDAPKGYDHSVRPVSKANRRDLLRMFSEYYDEGGFQASMRLRGMLSDKSYSVFAADGGFVVTRLEGEAGLIYDIYVTPARQGEGIGGELMRCGLTSLSGRASRAYLHTSYPRAKALYEKFGFKAVYSQLAVRLDETEFRPPSR